MKNILIINGNPNKNSFNYALSEAYIRGLISTQNTMSIINISELNFDPNLQYGYNQRTELEPGLIDSIEQIKKADHIVWIFPMWWYGYPAMMKGFIDRTFLPGITFQYIDGKPLPEKLLKGKTSRIIITADTPRWYDRFIMKSPLINQFKKGTLEFCGIKPVKVTYISSVKDSKPELRDKWLNKVFLLGKKAK